jgi:hypothetical protein
MGAHAFLTFSSLSPTKFGKLIKACWSGADQANEKQPRRAGMIVPTFGKNSRPAILGKTLVKTLGKRSCQRKARPED